ncbi:MAG: hypothetical protein CO186_05070 [Zetaproteobacteria bacterium CG_4_9_14_3_um_filter_49_83]|nr:MAG: hypothetical protein AUJ56_13330 [Zetaproteobacteria bacterium CG1_02_49_23]PIQ30545.1 MAG: hypothetical protein COW62_12120 [Zetaproteobacteria bacterium CG17_big_fil_post_rev_8_21_14_2_50_50_13]PIV30976.1 MAG: hypothetical protein COS35_03855 [Zetaproteobacteria bacterium CG02_land_8_20_14_3_00_50_9]PIY54915.1 MAG: hypothetical protein COZ00_12235 [Zetaproteobacteria bacterium CG_4_10_14_0_8_um_filter_49_80]PJA35590.1 MAG: hypothetical protein CO186_05070 [Zetaproteobacteria bacterium
MIRFFANVGLCLCLVSIALVTEAVVGKAVAVAVADEVRAETAPDAIKGKGIFDMICSHCHRTDNQASSVGAPGLKNVLDRHEATWIDQWIHNPELFAEKNETAKALINSNPYGLQMPTIPEMQDPENRANVIEFLKTLK